MPNYTLEDLHRATEKKYGHTSFDDLGVVLLNPLRLSKEKRAELKKAQEDWQKAQEAQEKARADYEAGKRKTAPQNDEEDAVLKHLAHIIRIVAETEAQAEKLLDYADGDLAVLSTVVEMWTDGTSPGEASPSGN